MNDFDRLLQLKRDFDITMLAYHSAWREGKDLIDGVKERLEMDRRQNEARAAELRQTVANTNRSETVRRVAAAELAKMDGLEYFATPEEVAAFTELAAEQDQAVADIKKINADILEAINGAEQTIKEIREKTRGRNDLDLLPRGTKSQKGAFNKLCKEEIYRAEEIRY